MRRTDTAEQSPIVSRDTEKSAVRFSENKIPLNGRALTALTRSQLEIVDAIRGLFLIADVWPSGATVARALGLTCTSTFRRIRKLVRLGVLQWQDSQVSILRHPDGVFLTLSEARS